MSKTGINFCLFVVGIPACRLDINGKLFTNLTGDQGCGMNHGNETDLFNGRFSIVECHPEALLDSRIGQKLLDDDQFTDSVKALVIDECHKTDQW